jgi:OPT family oligopeptide transporter
MFGDPAIGISNAIAQLVCFPLGRGLASVLPTKRFNTFGYIWSLNPGPFSIKEHVCISIMVRCSMNGAYSTRIALTQRLFYGQAIPMAFQTLLAIGSQCIGFCFAGILRQLVVWPANMIWPGTLSTCAFFNTLHRNYSNSNRSYIMTRERLFWTATAGTFIWYWVPGYLFTGLSMFNWVCWIAPKNVIINTLFGTNTGLGMSILTFNWAIISSLGSPLIAPVGGVSFFRWDHYLHWSIYSGGSK